MYLEASLKCQKHFNSFVRNFEIVSLAKNVNLRRRKRKVCEKLQKSARIGADEKRICDRVMDVRKRRKKWGARLDED